MPKVTDTYERAYQACALLAARGINPTVKTVAEAIGTNSPAIISPAIKDWRRSSAVESLRRLEIPEAPGAVADAAAALWRLAVEQAQAALAQERETLNNERAGWATQVERAEAARLDAEREQAAFRERAGQEAQSLRGALDRVEADLAAARQGQAEAAQALAQAREANAGLAAALEETRLGLCRQKAEWAEKYDRDHAWHLARIAEERERAKTEAEGQAARLEEALALSRRNAAALDGHLGQAAAANAELRGELKALREENGGLRQALEAARQEAAEQARQRQETERRLAEAEAQIHPQAAAPATARRRGGREKRPGVAKAGKAGTSAGPDR